MKFSAVVAVDLGWLIGAEGRLPWRISSDLKRFKALTMGKSLVMGRATYASIGRALPGRRCVVMTRREGFEAPGCEVVGSVREALELLEGEEEVVIGGGAQIYDLFAQRLDEVHLTVALGRWEGDTRMTPLSPEGWRVERAELHEAGERDDAAHAYVVLRRVEGEGALSREALEEVPRAWWSEEALERVEE